MFSAGPAVQPRLKQRPRLLVVDDEPGLPELIHDVVGGLHCKVTVARTMGQARKLLKSGTFELMLTDLNLPDGDGLKLLEVLRRQQPTASAIVITGLPTIDSAVTALRSGAVDFVSKPFNNDHLVDRVRKALDRQSVLARQEKRLTRLRVAVKRLGVARRMVSKKVDLLCNDLVSAYGELSKQMDTVRTEENYRKQISISKDLEQLLCHTMDWLLRQIGYANIALWLAGDDGEFQLGAYMKYTIAGDEPIVEAMRSAILPATVRDGFINFKGSDLAERLPKSQADLLTNQTILGMNCTYLGDPLAAIVFFRDSTPGFSDNDIAVIKAIAPIFANALAGIVRDPGLAGDEDIQLTDDPDRHDNEPHSRGEDWWKRGESPPF